MLDRDGGPVPLTVGGVYRTPADPVPAWWTAQNYLFVPRFEIGALDPTPPPPAVFLPPDLALPTYRTLGEDVFVEWFLPAPAAPTVGDARRTSEAVTELQLRLTDPESPVATLVKDEHFAAITPRTALPGALTRVDRTVELLSPPVRGSGSPVGWPRWCWSGPGRVSGCAVARTSCVPWSRAVSLACAAGIAVRESLLPSSCSAWPSAASPAGCWCASWAPRPGSTPPPSPTRGSAWPRQPERPSPWWRS